MKEAYNQSCLKREPFHAICEMLRVKAKLCGSKRTLGNRINISSKGNGE